MKAFFKPRKMSDFSAICKKQIKIMIDCDHTIIIDVPEALPPMIED